jgi:hypothetical protein
VRGDLPPALLSFVEAAQAALGDHLRSVVLFGSAAEGRLRPTSDVNLILVLRAFDVARLDTLRSPLRLAEAGIRLAPMFLLESELAAAEVAFASKFTDIGQRRRVLFGDDPFGNLAIPRSATVARLRQILLNTVVRSRERYLTQSLVEGRLALVVADLAGPLRGAAATLCALEGEPAPSPRDALTRIATAVGGDRFGPALQALSQARETGTLPADVARETTLALLDLADRMRARADALTP